MADKFQTILFLIRHGQTDHLFSSDSLVDNQRILNEEGRVASRKVGEYLEAFGLTTIYSSPLKRTLQTAEIIKEAADIPGEIIIENSLVEMYHGKGEYTDRATAVKDFFHKMIRAHAGEQVVLVSHQDPMEAMVEAMGFSAEELDLPCRMSQGYRLVFAGDKPVECQKIKPAEA